jgi:flagellar basal-body rod protein FlgG
MFGSMWTSASGMRASSALLDTTAHNMANVNTGGFRRHEMSFSQLARVHLHEMSAQPIYQPVPVPGPETAVIPLSRGQGVAASAVTLDEGQAPLVATGRPLDLAIDGRGYLILGDGSDRVLGYTRGRSFHCDSDGYLVDAAGRFLMQEDGLRLQVPVGAAGDLTIAPDGTVQVAGAEEGETEDVGQLHLVLPAEGSGIRPLGDGLYGMEDGTELPAGETGTIRQGYLETSNVDLGQEMLNLILAQRSFQLNGRVLQTADQMLDLASMMRR